MNGAARWTRLEWFYLLCCVVLCVLVMDVAGERVDTREPIKTESQLKLQEKAKEGMKEEKEISAVKSSAEGIAKLDLPEDRTLLMTAKELRVTGNALITTEELLSKIPLIYNASAVPLQEAESMRLYDFRTVREIIEMPGEGRPISARTIRGLTRCILGIYKSKGYSGIFVSVPPGALDGEELRDGILVINITEARVSSVTINYYSPESKKVEEGYLKRSFLHRWSPVEAGEVAKEKELADYVNLLNLSPDRYISATVSRGAEPDTLSIGYNVYEANPWHYFLQVDNAGTSDRQWTPRIGLVNTNLSGIDDRLTVLYQAPWDEGIEDEYSVYGNYDFPIMGPKLRLELFAGYNQFDTDGGGGIDFLGHGSLYGGKLRYNALQNNGWFFDLTTSLAHEKSKVSSSLFNSVLGSEVEMDLWGVGFDVHKRSDMANTSVTFDRIQSVGGSSQSRFTGARTNANRNFAIYTTAANHSRYLDSDKIQRFGGSVRWIVPDERLVPARMTTFGGMYSVRGYKESRIVADGGVLASAQYEYDLVRHDAAEGQSNPTLGEGFELRKLAPLAFFDYGRATMKNHVAGERASEELYSVGVGTLVEIGKNFSGALYYGYPLEATDATDRGDGRINISLMMRW